LCVAVALAHPRFNVKGMKDIRQTVNKNKNQKVKKIDSRRAYMQDYVRCPVLLILSNISMHSVFPDLLDVDPSGKVTSFIVSYKEDKNSCQKDG
jgi:hypothetical protein